MFLSDYSNILGPLNKEEHFYITQEKAAVVWVAFLIHRVFEFQVSFSEKVLNCT